MNNRIIAFIFLLTIAASCHAQMSSSIHTIPSKVSELKEDNASSSFVRDQFLVNVRVFEFEADKLNPWIEGITHLRAFGVDFWKGKGSDGQYQYVDDTKMNEFISFCQEKKLKVIWTLNLSSYTIDKEMAYLEGLFDKGLNIVGFQYGGEFWLKKYAYGEMDAKGVVERIRMDGSHRDYLDLLDNWIPVVTAKYPLDDYMHILVTGATTKENNLTQNYRREFNQKVFDYVTENPQLKGKVDFSYHLYAGAEPWNYKDDEENITTPERVSWDFISEKPMDSKWIVTESGYYTRTWSDKDLEEAREFYTMQSQKLNDEDIMGIHVLFIADRGKNNLALYNLNGRTKVGDNIDAWLSGVTTGSNGSSSEPTDASEDNSPSPTDSPVSSPGNPVLTAITPEYDKWYHFIHFSHTLTFSNGKSYDRSYWFSRPDFSSDDIGKPINYFKRVVKSK